MIGKSERKYVAKCPRCGEPHHYVEVKFLIENDEGHWKVPCASCRDEFVIELSNPAESYARPRFAIAERRGETYAGPAENLATDKVLHNLEPNKIHHRFDYEAEAIYCCDVTLRSLEAGSQKAFAAAFGEISDIYRRFVGWPCQPGFLTATTSLSMCRYHATAAHRIPRHSTGSSCQWGKSRAIRKLTFWQVFPAARWKTG